jgi:hypothetical protein
MHCAQGKSMRDSGRFSKCCKTKQALICLGLYSPVDSGQAPIAALSQVYWGEHVLY